MSRVRAHFDEEADRYDYWKSRNAYYYDAVKAIYRSRVPRGASVLEVGCGTGDLLASLQPARGVGIDISPRMIELARRKHPGLEWHAVTTSELERVVDRPFDVVFLSDVVEHLEDVATTFRDVRPFCHERTRLIVNMANPLWEPFLLLLEKLKLKMPEGPHERISVRALNNILVNCGFAPVDRAYRLLFPARVPLLSRLVNLGERIPVLRRLCLIEILEYRVSA